MLAIFLSLIGVFGGIVANRKLLLLLMMTMMGINFTRWYCSK